jgi:hypothetical protein
MSRIAFDRFDASFETRYILLVKLSYKEIKKKIRKMRQQNAFTPNRQIMS